MNPAVTEARSRNGVPIRLPDERWIHLTEGHSEMAGYYSEVLETLEDPDAIYEGGSGELLAIKEIHTFLSSRRRQLERRTKVWQRQK